MWLGNLKRLTVGNKASKKDKALIGLGLLFCLAGLALNEYILGYLLTPSGSFHLALTRIAIGSIDVGLIVWGLTTIIQRKREFVTNFNLALMSLLIISPFLVEAFIRTAIYLDVAYFRNPRLYAGFEDDEDQWKLRYLWQSETRQALKQVGLVVDPLLGWSPQKSAENPLGVLAAAPYIPDFSQKTVLFYGDSFVYGVEPTPIDKRLPQQLGDLLSNYQVYNYGVSGYGVDQIFLRFRETYPAFQKPFIIVGILTLDLDRSIFSVRDAPKPYFELENEQLVLKGVPVPENTAEWYKEHPPSINSYLGAMITRHYQLMQGGFNETEVPYKQAEKKRINAKIIEEMVREAQTHHLPLLFVIFYPAWELGYTGWREAFLKDLLTRQQVPYLDTKELFLREATKRSLKLSAATTNLIYYPPPNNHFNEFGNKVVAEAIARYLADK